MLPLRASVRSELRIPVVYRDPPPRFPACSICKPPRNESVNPVTSFAAILALRRRRRRRRWYSHFPPNPPACLRLQCKSVETPIHRRRRIVPAVRSGPMQIRSRLRLSLAFLPTACYILVIYALSRFPCLWISRTNLSIPVTSDVQLIVDVTRRATKGKELETESISWNISYPLI